MRDTFAKIVIGSMKNSIHKKTKYVCVLNVLHLILPSKRYFKRQIDQQINSKLTTYCSGDDFDELLFLSLYFVFRHISRSMQNKPINNGEMHRSQTSNCLRQKDTNAESLLPIFTIKNVILFHIPTETLFQSFLN